MPDERGRVGATAPRRTTGTFARAGGNLTPPPRKRAASGPPSGSPKPTGNTAAPPRTNPKTKAKVAKTKAKAAKANQKATTRAKAKAERLASRPDRRRAAMRTALVAVVAVGLLFAFVYPTRTFLDQRSQTNKARAQLELLRSENTKLTKDAKRLSSDAEIEQLARERYGLVKPGEKPFVVLPAPTTAPATPTTAPPATATPPGGSTPSNAP